MAVKMTTHVLDTASGKPANGMRIEFYRVLPEGIELINHGVTNTDGRLDAPLNTGHDFDEGTYRLLFYVGDYFASVGHADAKKFLDIVPIQFVVDKPGAYHVPLLVSPWAYSTYRGS